MCTRPVLSIVSFALASGPLSIFAGARLIATAGAKLRPRSVDRATMTWPPADQASQRLPSGAKAGVAAVAQARSDVAQGGGAAECRCCAAATEIPMVIARVQLSQAMCRIAIPPAPQNFTLTPPITLRGAPA